MTMARPAETGSEDSWTFLLRAWQEADVPEGFRAEIREEGIVLVPPPGGPHNLMADLVQEQLYRQIPYGCGVYQTLGLAFPHMLRLRIPDLVVARRSDIRELSGSPLDASAALLVVEIVSPTGQEVDRVVKRKEYARAEIPLYVLIDAYDGAGTVTHFSNPREGEYDTSRRTTFGEDVLLPKPVELKIVTSEFE